MMADVDRRRLQEALIAPCQVAMDQGHTDAVFAAISAAFAALVLASGLSVERALAIHNEQVRLHVAQVANARAVAAKGLS